METGLGRAARGGAHPGLTPGRRRPLARLVAAAMATAAIFVATLVDAGRPLDTERHHRSRSRRLGVRNAADQILARVGAAWQLGRHLRLDGAVGTGLGTGDADLIFTLGATFRF